jgi:hypothetical protein
MIHCLKCIEEYLTDQQEPEPTLKFEDIKEAFTEVPSWQQTTVSGPMGQQTMMACVPTPVCFDHITYTPPSPAQQAAASGRLVLPQ